MYFKIETDDYTKYCSITQYKPTRSRNFTFVSTGFIFTTDSEADTEDGEFITTRISDRRLSMYNVYDVISFVFENEEYVGEGKFYYK